MNKKYDSLAHSTINQKSILSRLFKSLPQQELQGHYNSSTQTWSHRDASQFSPVKTGQEM